MEKSLYFEYVQKYFPMLVTSIVERLNEKRANALPYLYKQWLRPEFSADGRWASILADYNRVAADVVALDAELPLKSRDSIETETGDIPKIGMELYLSEKQMKDIDAMIAQNMPIGQIVNKIFTDLPRCIEGVYERLEDMFLSGLSTGVALAAHNNGTGARVSYGYYDANKFGVKVLWGNPDTDTPITDLQKIFTKAIEDQNVPTTVWMDDVALNNFFASKQVREQYAFDNRIVVTSTSTVPTLDQDKSAEVLRRKWGVNLVRVARTIKTEINGKKNSHKPWQEGMVVVTCDDNLGTLAWTNTAESTHPVNGVDYQTADDFILLSKYRTNKPLREFTSSQAMVVPIINNVDRIYTLDTKTVQA